MSNELGTETTRGGRFRDVKKYKDGWHLATGLLKRPVLKPKRDSGAALVATVMIMIFSDGMD